MEPLTYSKRICAVVAQGGRNWVGRWIDEQRDVAADFRAAFGERSPAITGIAIGTDTDRTGGSARGRFADIAFHPSQHD